MTTTRHAMDKADKSERFSWFGAVPEPIISPLKPLLDKYGNITPLGKQYIAELSQRQNDTSVY